MKCQVIPISQWGKIEHGGLTVIIAKSPCQKQQGLQGVKLLPEKTFVLFLNILPKTTFHTKNCFISMDIIPLDYLGRILDIWTVTPGVEVVGPTPAFTNKVIETNAGWAKQAGLKKGDMIPLILI